MNVNNNQALIDLVAEYEAQQEQGHSIFWGEKAFHQLLDYYESEEQYDRALEVVEQALLIHGFSAEFFIRQASFLLRLGKATETLQVLDQANALSPNDLQVKLLRIQAVNFLGHHQEALRQVEALFPLSGLDLADALFVQALILERLGQTEQMYQVLCEALRLNSDHREALERLWICIEATKKYEEGIRFHEELLDIDPYSSIAWFNLGLGHSYLGNYQQAVDAFEYAYLTDPSCEQAYREYADLCFELKQFRKALDCYQEMLEHFPPDSEVYLHSGQCFLELERIKEARACFREALRLDPLSDEVLFQLGECYALDKQWKQAAYFYQKAIQIEEEREEYYAACGEAFYRLGQLDAAEAQFQEAVNLGASESRYWIQYISFLLATGQPEEALAVAEAGVEETDGEGELTFTRVACILALGRRQEALNCLAEALEDDYEAHRVLLDLIPTAFQDPDIVHLIHAYR